jgi:hypothetical protein
MVDERSTGITKLGRIRNCALASLFQTRLLPVSGNKAAHLVMQAMATSSFQFSQFLMVYPIKTLVTLHIHDAVHWK